MSFNTIFVLNSEGDLEVNKPEIKSIEEYKALYDRDKGTRAGTKMVKYVAPKEMLYIYLITDPRSMYYSLPTTIRQQKAKEHCKFPSNWSEDYVLQKAIHRYYTDMQLNSVANSYFASDRVLFNASNDINNYADTIESFKIMLNNKLREFSEASNNGSVISATSVSYMKEATSIVAQITEIQKKQMDLIDKLPKLTNITKELAAKYAEAGGALKVVVGGGELYNRED